jgi:hypothetical protein
MDLSVFNKKDWMTRQRVMSIKALAYNKNPKVISIVAFIGAHDARQAEALMGAIDFLSAHFKPHDILIDFHPLTNTIVKELDWTVSETIDVMLSADLHAIPTHFHQGNQTASRDSFNMCNINTNLDRLEYHPGIPCGRHTYCPVWRQDKWNIYDILLPLDLCAPTIGIDLHKDCYKDRQIVDEIKR